ncbi:MAG: response regulator [Chitinophagaceae bacterium]|nr:MAG: response regulator [Chitinophagaceae bacterium]
MTADKTILIIDDDPDDRSLFAEVLSEADGSFSCVQAGCGDEAVDLLLKAGARLPLFIFLDVNMPLMNGWQCLSPLRKMERLKAVPIIIYTTSKSDKIKKGQKAPVLLIL